MPWILGALSAVLLVGNGVLAYLRADDDTASRAEIVTQDAQIEDLEDRVEQLESANERRQRAIDDLKDDLAKNQALIEDRTECPAKVQSYLDAILYGGEAELTQAIGEMVASCHVGR